MKRQLRDEWVTALRSGRYKQGKNQLKKGDSFCCLGVLCDLSGVDLDGKYLGGNGGVDDYGLTDELNVLREIPESQRDRLAGANDAGNSFAEIADWIEKNIDVED
jgi:hypothetical protein